MKEIMILYLDPTLLIHRHAFSCSSLFFDVAYSY